MTLPLNLVLVRHGESEANIVQRAGPLEKPPAEFGSRHDSNMRLSPKGSQQARAAGKWLRENRLSNFDDGGFGLFYCSPHTRTRETAGHLRLGGSWTLDDRLRERDWGELASLSRDEQKAKYPESMRLKEMNEWYWKPSGGESLATGVRSRIESFMSSMYRRSSDEGSVIAVAHHESIGTAQLVIERMNPDEWNARNSDPAYKIQNCMIVQYTRISPETGEVTKNYNWRRVICPWDESLSWDGGAWKKLTIQRLSDDELLESAYLFNRIF